MVSVSCCRAHGLWKSLSPVAELPAGQRLRETCHPADEDGGPKGVSGMVRAAGAQGPGCTCRESGAGPAGRGWNWGTGLPEGPRLSIPAQSLLSCGRVSWACPSADTRRRAAFDETRPLSTSSPRGRTLAGLPPQPSCSRVSSRRP